MYTEYQPSYLLAPYIDNYWEFKGKPEYGMRIHILPDGCTDFIFTLGDVVSTVKEETLVMQPYSAYPVLQSYLCMNLRTTESVRMRCRQFSILPLLKGCVSKTTCKAGFRSLKNIS